MRSVVRFVVVRFVIVRFVIVMGLVTALAGPVACTDPAVDGGAEGEGEGDGQSVDLGCAADDDCGDGLVCDGATATCVPGFDCSVNTTICGFCGAPDVDCGFDAAVAAAFCDVDHGGVCRRSKGACAPCDADDECAPGATGLPSRCRDDGAGGFCAPGCGPCADGFVCVDGGCQPQPQAGTCSTAVLCGDGAPCPDGQACSALGVCLSLCAGDGDCPLGSICAEEPPLRGTCVTGCVLGQRVQQDGVERVCHGDGRYGDPCFTPGASTGCPAGTECRADGACERAGCQSDAECPLPRTYCDVGSAGCVDGCNDADDCAAFELCEGNRCVAQGCRGKNASCENGQFCCGTELYATGDCVDRAGAAVDDGLCFLAPDPFCRACESDDDCADIDAFGFASFCFELQRQDESGNAQTLGKFCSTGCRDNDDCPRGLRCLTDLPTPDGGTTSGCLESLCAAFP
ncbi:MAG: hypothetical protein FJ137_19315 [Deltaproteobacteria bacterium]|nr:hypothetical protein [Deltaproteobacteria bacterium]